MAEIQLDDVADELYGLTPDAFTAARDAWAKRARADGLKALAGEVAGLRRPTASAWVLNRLARDERDAVERWLAVGADLARAQVQGPVAEFHRLSGARRALEMTLLKRADALAEQAGVKLGAAGLREVQETLAAAAAGGEVAEALRKGRIVRPTSYAGFGELPVTGFVAEASSATATSDGQAAEAAAVAPPTEVTPRPEEARAEREAARAAEEAAAAERRRDLARQIDEAQAAAEAAAAALVEHTRAATVAELRRAELKAQVEQARARLAEAEAAAAVGEEATREAALRRERAVAEHAAALERLVRAEQQLALG